MKKIRLPNGKAMAGSRYFPGESKGGKPLAVEVADDGTVEVSDTDAERLRRLPGHDLIGGGSKASSDSSGSDEPKKPEKKKGGK